ncbi:2,3-dihydro-2,3-dihydroxybenzoate dehydrogenase [Pseudonocardia autotrophica]|uniref:2,3-dihydro-2,3-dihydroxybenzoate dehydrogenase n=1 Tax=Pseudonocardia autotrophica TaxID=2074 RepID=A0A1Y2NAE2_PSEAH|nr:2,3-dihydro-2,3-dihydroxybenzoate dehydrogenase [Pseudonocardia autotrophica]TDN74223.1 2,3-dihydro-2,3-dihydroxybenzoate dehydrogenase [Pseudonocardia autotrophica]
MTSDPYVALVTGAARGIGAEVASALAAQGRPVALLDRDPGVAGTAAALAAGGAQVLPLVADVADAGAVADAVDAAEQELGPLGLLVNAAGVLRTGSVLDADDADLAACLAVNTTGVWNAGRAAGRRMYGRGSGAIVTVASDASRTPRAGMAAYAASKAASVSLTRTLGLELAPHVRCNVVCPGATDTAMQRALWPDPDDDTGAAAVVAGAPQRYRLGIPLGRIAQPGDVAAAVLFLAGDAARHITMQTLTVDGGASLGS